MAEETSNPTEKPDEPSAAEGKSSRLAKIKVPAFVAAVILAECVLAYAILPSASDTAAMAETALGVNGESGAGDPDAPQDDGVPIDQIEEDLGEFTVSAFQPVSGTTLRIDFHLWATVAEKDYNEFSALMESSRNRFREQVIVTIRSADITDLTDAQLGLIRRKILEKTNRILGKPFLRTVIFSDFSFVEQ